LMLSYIHPFGFDWFKPELLFVQSYFGIEKWRFAIILTALVLLIWKRNPLVLIVLLLAYAPDTTQLSYAPLKSPVALVTTMTPVEQKWDEKKHARQFAALFAQIQEAIDAKKETVVLPESVFPVFLNYNATYFDHLHQLAKKINIVTGALYLDEEKVPRNATYIFTKEGKVQVANKVILVPLERQTPCPTFLATGSTASSTTVPLTTKPLPISPTTNSQASATVTPSALKPPPNDSTREYPNG